MMIRERNKIIIGIGNDIIELDRIAQVLRNHPQRFLDRVFTKAEQARAKGSNNQVASLAKRFAGKEAVVKALGTGKAQGISWQEVEIITLPSGQPQVVLKGMALEHLNRLCPEGRSPSVHISLSDCQTFAQATVVISAD